jgi:DNA-binding CsgD family transcriptional regulator
VLAIGRDQNLCVFWVNGLQEQLSGMKPEEYLGRSLESMMPRSVAEERRRTLEAVLEDNQPRTIYMLAGETRMLVRLLPIDAGAFGHKGVMALMCQAPLGHDPDAQTIAAPRTMSNSVLRSLSRRELEVLHLVARGHTTAEIAASLHRTEKAINHHLSGLHRAFHTSTRTELMQEAIKRGIGTFTPDEWLRIGRGRDAAPSGQPRDPGSRDRARPKRVPEGLLRTRSHLRLMVDHRIHRLVTPNQSGRGTSGVPV